MTLSSIFIGNMPGDHTRMVFEFFRQFCIHNSCLFSVYRRCITVVMSFSIQISVTAGIYTKHLRILLCHPSWSCSGRGGKNCRNTIFIQTVNDLFHPFKMKLSLYRFQYCPGKYTKGHFIDFRFFKIFDVFFQNLRAVKPLFRIVISTVEHFSKIYFSCHMFFSCITGKAFLPSLQGERLFLSFHYLFVNFHQIPLNVNVNSIFSSVLIRYSGSGFAPQLSSPAIPICCLDTRTTV